MYGRPINARLQMVVTVSAPIIGESHGAAAGEIAAERTVFDGQTRF